MPSENVLAVGIQPELERLLVPVWPKVKVLLGAERAMEPPTDAAIFAKAREIARGVRGAEDFSQLLARHPKEAFEALVQLVRLKRAAPLYEQIGRHTSLPAVKKDETAARMAATLGGWFASLPEVGE